MSQSKKPLNSGLRIAAAAVATTKSDGTVLAVDSAMKMIDAEMAEHDNIYPHNDGKLNQRELCRRAGISFMTLQAPAHKETTRKKVKTWLTSKSTVTKTTAAKAVTDRVDYWKKQHRLVATQIHIYELEHKENDLTLRKLQNENKALRVQLAQSNNGRVVSIAKKSSREQ